jgi:hypothetical protein
MLWDNYLRIYQWKSFLYIWRLLSINETDISKYLTFAPNNMMTQNTYNVLEFGFTVVSRDYTSFFSM